MSSLSLGALLCAAAAPGFGQDFSHFEAASVKPTALAVLPNGGVPVPRLHGGPGTDDPGRISWVGVTLWNLIIPGYEIPSFRITFPAKFQFERYDIEATIPHGATERQFHLMLQNLLADRFHMAAHYENRTIPVYVVTVSKSGSKLKEPSKDPPPQEAMPRATQGEDGFPILTPGYTGVVGFPASGRMRLAGQRVKIDQLLSWLDQPLGRPVID